MKSTLNNKTFCHYDDENATYGFTKEKQLNKSVNLLLQDIFTKTFLQF